jgi:uncharacterized LabA/DUF88 family protein
VTDQRLRLAVFIDFDNIEIGVKQTLNASFDAGIVLEALKERGDVVSKTAYSDWQRAGSHSRGLTQHAIKMVQRNLTPGGDKNGADINLALDALEMAFTHSHINAFVIVGGDSDFISLVEKLKQYDKKVFIVGGRQFTSGILQRNCHEFIAYENLIGATAPAGASGGGRRRQSGRNVGVERTPIEQAIPLVKRALAVLTEREVSPQLGLLKSTLLQLDSTFSERSYGAGSFRDFVDKLAAAGVLRVHQGKGGWLVAQADEPSVPADAGDDHDSHPREDARRDESRDARPAPAPAQVTNGHATNGHAGNSPVAVVGTPAEGLHEFRKILSAATIRRWPMYLRNVKQIFRQMTPAFDERAYGYGSLVDLLRAAQREGIVRVDRDRQGVVRVFQGSSPVTPVAEPVAGLAPDAEIVEAQPIEIVDADAVEVTMAPGADDGGPAANDSAQPAAEAAPKRRRRAPAPRTPRRSRKPKAEKPA